jgi:magnesium chelatase accessory protein
MGEQLDWAKDGSDWPNRELSRFVDAAGLRWHVQCGGRGPVLLLVHGTGAATHSWAGLLPLLTPHFTVIAPDLPGHGFTTRGPATSLSLPGMSAALAELLRVLTGQPSLVVGHSAGAAILTRMTLDRRIDPAAIVSLNGALLPLRGLPGQVFSPLARLLARSSLLPRLFAGHMARGQGTARLLASTGSTLDAKSAAFYERLARTPGHVAAALGMMAQWDLAPLQRELPQLDRLLYLVVGLEDGTVPPVEAQRIRMLAPQTAYQSLPGLGHLAHEERPVFFAELLLQLARDRALLHS